MEQPTTTFGTLLREKLDQWDKEEAAQRKLPEQSQVEKPVETEQSPVKRPVFQTTNNVSRETFNAIRDNPGSSRPAITQMLGVKGFRVSSVSSLIGQMLEQGMVRIIDDRLYVTQSEYTPIKSSRASRLRVKKETRKAPSKTTQEVIIKAPRSKPVVPKHEEGIAALPAKVAQPQTNRAWDAKTMIDHLSVRQARDLYDELHKIFGAK